MVNIGRLTADGKTLSNWRAFLCEWISQRGEGAYYWNTDGGTYANTGMYIGSTWRTQNTPNYISSTDVNRAYGGTWTYQTNQQWVNGLGRNTNRAHYWQTDCIGILNAWLAWKVDREAWANGNYTIAHGWQSNGWQVTTAVNDAAETYYMGQTITANCQGFCRWLNGQGLLHTMEDFPEGTDKSVLVFSGLESRIFNWSERLSDSIGHSGYYVGKYADDWSGAGYGFGSKNIVESTSINQSSYNYATAQKTWGTVKKRYGVQLCGYNNGSQTVNQVCKDGQTRAVRMRRSANGGIWSYWAYNPFVVDDFAPWVYARKRRERVYKIVI